MCINLSILLYVSVLLQVLSKASVFEALMYCHHATNFYLTTGTTAAHSVHPLSCEQTVHIFVDHIFLSCILLLISVVNIYCFDSIPFVLVVFLDSLCS